MLSNSGLVVAATTVNSSTCKGTDIAYYYILSVPYVAGLASFGGPYIGGFRLTGWVFVVMLALAPLAYLIDKSPNRFPIGIWLPWILIVVLSLLWADGFTIYHLQDVCQILTPFFIAPIASKAIRSAEDLDRLLRSFFHCLIILIVALTLSVVFSIEVLPRSMAMTAAIVGCVIISQYRERRLMSILGWCGCILVTGLTGSRMATVALLLAVLVLPIYRRSSTRMVIGSIVAIVALGLFYSPVFQDRFFGADSRGTLADLATGEFSSAGRFEAWPEFLDEIKRRPLLGGGARSSAIIVGEVWENIGKPHNDYLRILLEQGFVGLACFLFGVICQLYSLWKRGFTGCDPGVVFRSAAFTGIIVFLLMAVTDNPIIYGVWFMHPLFVIIGVSYSPVFESQSESLAGRRPFCS